MTIYSSDIIYEKLKRQIITKIPNFRNCDLTVGEFLEGDYRKYLNENGVNADL